MRLLLDLVYFLAALAVSPILVYRVIRHGRYRTGWAQRFGKVSRKGPGKKCIWLHAVSMGEVNAAKTLVTEIEKQFPDCEIVVSTTTDTGYAQADKLFGRKGSVFYFPFDISWIIRRAFNRLEPSICLLMELEVWPNFLFAAHQRHIPVVVLNGRISDRSFSRYRRIRCVTRTFFGRIDRVLAQTEQYAERFRDLGCPAERVLVTSSLKYDTAQVADRVEGAQVLAEQLNLGAARLWVAGGTGNDEEKIVLDVYKSLVQEPAFRDLRLAVVPRKPERFDEVAQLIEQMGFPVVRYSRLKGTPRGEGVPPLRHEAILASPPKEGRGTPAQRDKGGTPSPQRAVILGDTMGDLRKFYSLAEIIFVGRTLVPMGGSDMMEAAALGKCTLFGPHTFNFRQTVEVLLQGHGAIEVKDSDDLLATMKKCLSDRAHAQAVARAGQQIIRENQGATAKTMEVLRTLLQ
ncbi:MAG: 3-deoxy-D-manno-octulosonic acid transferase [Phycisphaerae bacterium]|nr:3-deoxy-D-manno-octulosonic acid transferase [Phycisphaerae bacterium]